MTEPNELDILKEKARELGIPFHPSIGLEKLKEKIQGKTTADDYVEEPIHERNRRLRMDAERLVRCRISCMDPTKANHPGDIFSVSNSAIGVIRKYVPFQTDSWHLPFALYKMLKNKKYSVFFEVMVNGNKVKRSRLSPMFSIEELPPLTTEELKTLAAEQAARG